MREVKLVHNAILDKRSEIAAVCRKHRAARLEVFGSAARGEDFNPETSDADFIVEFLPPLLPGVARRYFGLAFDLESILGRKVDLLTEGGIKNRYFREAINESRELVYEP